MTTPHPLSYKMHYLYLLKSSVDSSTYIGITNSVIRRLKEHNEGKDQYTKKYKPWELMYYEAYQSVELAASRERQLKRFAKSYSMLKKRIGL